MPMGSSSWSMAMLRRAVSFLHGARLGHRLRARPRRRTSLGYQMVDLGEPRLHLAY